MSQVSRNLHGGIKIHCRDTKQLVLALLPSCHVSSSAHMPETKQTSNLLSPRATYVE